MVVGNYCYVAVCSAALGASVPTEGGGGGAYRGGRPPTYSLFSDWICVMVNFLSLSLLLCFIIADFSKILLSAQNQDHSGSTCTSVVVESNEFESESESSWSESKSSWLISDLGIHVAREPKNANFEKCNHKNLSTLKTVVTKLGLSHMQ